MTALSTAKLNAQQFLLLGLDPPGRRLELVHGEISVSPSPSPDHSYVDTMLRTILTSHVRAYKLGRIYGDVDTILDADNVRRPDILFFTTERLHLVGKKAMQGPPDLCVEILSLTSRSMDRDEKFKLYEARGVAHYWIVDIESRTIQAYVLRAGVYGLAAEARGETTASFPPFPNLAIDLGDLWP